MRKNLAVCIFMTLVSAQAHAFVDDGFNVAEQRDLTPPASLLLGVSPVFAPTVAVRGTSFLGRAPLPPSSLFMPGAAPLVGQVIAYFQDTTGGGADLELTLIDPPASGSSARLSFVQSVGGVPVVGTYALAQVQSNAITYAQSYLVVPPTVSTTPSVPAATAAASAVSDARGFAHSAALAPAPIELAILHVGAAPHLVWQVDVTTEAPYASWQIFVDAHDGRVVSRHKTSLNAVSGTVQGSIEPACQGDTPRTVPLPWVKWTTGEYADENGDFQSNDTVAEAQVSLHGRYFNVLSLSTLGKSWALPLQASPAHNDLVLEEAPLGLLDPYVHANSVRAWARTRLQTLKNDAAAEKALEWTEKTVPVVVNISLQRCNAAYIPLLGTLTFFAGEDGKCNNAAQIAKVVYHEYGHGLHHHLSPSLASFNPQVSEGAGDYVAATITNDPEMTGLLACKDTLPTRNKAVRRTCSNHYTYCKDKKACDTYPSDEPHTSAPIICGAWWDLRDSFSKRYGDSGVAKADALFLKFLSLSTTMDQAYTAAIAADEDDDSDPSNGTKHSCEINRAFLGDDTGSGAHFPDSIADKVPCKRR